jgi:hypothetical protein
MKDRHGSAGLQKSLEALRLGKQVDEKNGPFKF